MITLDKNLLKQVKVAFVPMPGGQAEPVAGASPMTAGMVAPMGDPSMGGTPMDPGMDPGMMGGMPPPGLDPAMAGMMGGGMPPPEQPPEGGAQGSGTITLTINDLIKLFKVFTANAPQQQAQPQQSASDPKLDEIIALLRGAM